MKQPDLAIFGMQRSGSTMLAGLLHQPPDHVILCEPWLNRCGAWKRHQHKITGAQKWGLKEVNAAVIRETLALYRPGRILIPVRDVRSVLMSNLDWIAHGSPFNNVRKHIKMIEACAQWVVEFLANPLVPAFAVRYEDFVTDPEERQRVAQCAGWPMQGDPAHFLNTHHRWSRLRRHEIDRHQGEVTAASMELHHAQSASPEAVAACDEVASACREYQSLFGYGTDREDWTVSNRFDDGSARGERTITLDWTG